jgi:polysaccharide pyruvyl transferase WcaK-like protein
MRIVAPFGFYGSGNIGDEATLHGFACLLEISSGRATAAIGSRNPRHTARVEPAFRYFKPGGLDPRRWWAKLRASAHAIVGGTPIMDTLGDWPLNELTPLVESTDKWKVPLAFIGVGVERLRRDKSVRVVRDAIATRVSHWSVRSDRDRERLVEYGVRSSAITVAADLAWLIKPVPTALGATWLGRTGLRDGAPLIGVNVVNENALFHREPQVVGALAGALDALVDRYGAMVVFLSNEVRAGDSFDRAAAAIVAGRMKRAGNVLMPEAEYLAPRNMMSIVGCCALTISMRYHFCLFSALQSVPFVAVSRSDKVADLCWDMPWKAAVTPASLDARQLIDYATDLMENGPAVRQHLLDVVAIMRRRTILNLKPLDALRKLDAAALRANSAVIR